MGLSSVTYLESDAAGNKDAGAFAPSIFVKRYDDNSLSWPTRTLGLLRLVLLLNKPCDDFSLLFAKRNYYELGLVTLNTFI